MGAAGTASDPFEGLPRGHFKAIYADALEIGRAAEHLVVADLILEPDGAQPRLTTNNRSYFGREMASYTFGEAIKC